MAEVAGVTSKISDYLIDHLNGQILPYNGEDHTITCEHQRFEDPDDVSVTPYCTVNFITAEKSMEGSQSTYWKLLYTVNLFIDGINDEYVKGNNPIKDVCKNVIAYLATFCLEDRTMDGNCTNTDLVQFSENIYDFEDGHYAFFATTVLECRLFTNSQSLFTRTG